jgi:hypothetical protein
MKAKLIRLASTNKNMRTKDVEGEYFVPPTIGERFKFIGESLSFSDGIRLIDTSPVTTITPKLDRIEFTTENSTYELVEGQK